MWQTTNRTPFAAHGYPVRDAVGCEHWGVTVRGSFDLPGEPGGHVALAERQAPVALAPDHYDDGEELLADPDPCPFRPGCDVTLVGVAHPPAGRAVKRFPVRLAVGPIDKTIDCYGPRAWRRTRLGGEIELLGPAEPTPLSWRQTTGGLEVTPPRARKGEAPEPRLHRENPIGAGWISAPARLPLGKPHPLPPLAPADLPPDTPPNRLRPVGFGAVAPGWPVRARLAGTFDTAWEETRHPLLPVDFDPAFWHAAPADQRADLRGGEAVTVSSVDPDGDLAFRLPQVLLSSRVQLRGRTEEVRLRLVSVQVDAEFRRLTMVWCAAVPCPGADTQVRGATVRMRQAAAVDLA